MNISLSAASSLLSSSCLFLHCQQACTFRDSYEKFNKAWAEVVGMSGDDSLSHKMYKLPLTKMVWFSSYTYFLYLHSYFGAT
ncbi:thioredoxin-dependent peroxiredoxin [Trifolium repens]|nr:thioredoxin-dependent peroxiredoxin [Trifolium repens]